LGVCTQAAACCVEQEAQGFSRLQKGTLCAYTVHSCWVSGMDGKPVLLWCVCVCPIMQVNVGEDEPEDIAVRKFMKKVMDSGVIEEVSRAGWWQETCLDGCCWCRDVSASSLILGNNLQKIPPLTHSCATGGTRRRRCRSTSAERRSASRPESERILKAVHERGGGAAGDTEERDSCTLFTNVRPSCHTGWASSCPPGRRNTALTLKSSPLTSSTSGTLRAPPDL